MKEDRANDDVVTKPAGKNDALELASGVESSEDITPLHCASAAAGGDHDIESSPVTAKDSKEARKMRQKN